jgi:hypothetical protein
MFYRVPIFLSGRSEMNLDRNDIKDVIIIMFLVVVMFAAVIGLFVAAAYLFPSVFDACNCCCRG